MKAQEYLSQAIWLDQMIDNKIEQQERLRTLAERTTIDVSQERVSGSSIVDPRGNIIVKLVDLSHEINDDIDRLIDLQREIQHTIHQVNDARSRVLLEMRYLNNTDWNDVAALLGCDKRTAFRIHRQALAEIEKSLENVTQCR